MSFRRAVKLAVVRTLVGAALLGGVAAAASLFPVPAPVPPTLRPAVLWGALAAERLGLWLCLGI